MKKLTKKEMLRRHWILWNWLAEHPECENKLEAFISLGWNGGGDIDHPNNNCYLCEIDTLNWDTYGVCEKCPLGENAGFDCDCDAFQQWDYSDTKKNRRKYALLIRDVVPKPEGV